MTTGEYLVSKSLLPSGTALAHLLAMQGTGGGDNYFAEFFVATHEMGSTIIEPERPAVAQGFARALPASTPTHPFTTTNMHFCTSRTPSVFVLLGRKT